MTSTGPTLSSPCPACGALIDAAFHYCPYCGHMARLVCTVCRTPLQEDWSWCPTCGHGAAAQSISMPTRILSGGMDSSGMDHSEPLRISSEAEDFNQRGVELYEAERYDEAIEQFKLAIERDAANSLYHCNLAVAYGERGDDVQAFQEYLQALELNPLDLTAHLNLGYAYNEAGELEKARDEWQRLISIAPDSPEAEEARDNLRNIEA